MLPVRQLTTVMPSLSDQARCDKLPPASTLAFTILDSDYTNSTVINGIAWSILDWYSASFPDVKSEGLLHGSH